jgi:ornithine cyclodeaminase
MVQFLDVSNLIRLVNAMGKEAFFHGLATAIEADFQRWEQFDKMPRVASHSEEGVIELMPTDDGTLYGFKYVNGHPYNVAKGLQTVTAYGMLADVKTGYPFFLSELTLTTAFRTGATSAMAARYLARKNASTMALIGCGAQSEFQALAFKASLGISRLRIYDIEPAAMEKFTRNLEGLGFEITPCTSTHEAVQGADIITTVTADKKNATILTADMLSPGVHINGVGGDCPGKTEIARDVLLQSRIFTEFTPQTRIEGDIQQLPEEHPVTELWEVIQGKAPGREHESDITFFDSVGFAIEDFASLRYLYECVQGTDYVRELDILSVPQDPKNLFGLLNGDAPNTQYARAIRALEPPVLQ